MKLDLWKSRREVLQAGVHFLGRGPSLLPNYDIRKDGGNLDCIWAIQFPYQISVAISGHYFLSPILRNHINHETLNFHQQYPRVARNDTFRLHGLTNTNGCTTTATQTPLFASFVSKQMKRKLYQPAKQRMLSQKKVSETGKKHFKMVFPTTKHHRRTGKQQWELSKHLLLLMGKQMQVCLGHFRMNKYIIERCLQGSSQMCAILLS